MKKDELLALADALRFATAHVELANCTAVSSATVNKAAAYLRQCAEQKPVAWIDEWGNVFPLGAWVRSDVRADWKMLYAHPFPQEEKP